MKILFLLLSFLVFPVVTYASGAWPYTDSDSYYSHFEAIYQTKEWGVFSGYPDGTFRGSDEMNRAELSKVLVLGSGVAEEDVSECADSATQSFSDVPNGEWYSDYVYCAQSKGWVSGDDGKDTFRPGDPILLAEAFKMLVESQHGSPDDSYSGSEWYDLYTNFLSEFAIIEIRDSYSYYEYFRYTFSAMHDDTASIGFNSVADSKMTRADIAELIYRLRVVFESEEAESFNPFLTLDEYASLYGVEIDGTESLSVYDSYFGYQFEDVPLKDFEADDIRVYVAHPSGIFNGYSTNIYFLTPDEDTSDSSNGYFDTGYDEFFYIDIDSSFSSTYHDFESEGLAYYFGCPVAGSTTVSELLAQMCVVDEDQHVDSDYVNFSSY